MELIKCIDVCKSFGEKTALDHVSVDIPKGKIFVLGDFRTQTTDSRKLGAIPTSDVEGVTIGLLRRRKF